MATQNCSLFLGFTLSHLTGATLQDDVIANFQFQRLGSYWWSQSLQIYMHGLCRLTASLQKKKEKMQSNIFENIFEAADH